MSQYIVINKCYGGFSLSPLAVKRLAELQGKPCYFFTNNLATKTYQPLTPEEAESQFMWNAFTVPNPDEIIGDGDQKWGELTMEEKQAHNQRFDSIHLTCRPDKRDDPLLVQVVRELGDKANGSCSELKIVEVPDGISWEIDEYDGLEHIAEIHRVWN